MRIKLLLLGLITMLTAEHDDRWRVLAPGLDIGEFIAGKPAPIGDSKITILRIDPNLWDLEFAGVNRAKDSKGQMAKQWCEQFKFTAAINAGMFGTDLRTHIGYLQWHGRVSSSHVNGYQSIAAFNPIENRRVPPFRIFDLDEPGITLAAILKDYGSAVQNLRLIKRPGFNQWSAREQRWSEAALGEDTRGRILFIFSRTPFTMHDLNHELTVIGVVSAQHLEGGPEAQFYLHLGDTEIEMFGSYETAFRQDDKNETPWPIPNVLGIRHRGGVK